MTVLAGLAATISPALGVVIDPSSRSGKIDPFNSMKGPQMISTRVRRARWRAGSGTEARHAARYASGRHVDAYVKAFNTGDEKTFLAANEKTMVPELLAKRPAEERAKMFQRLRGDFGTLKVTRILKSTPAQIAFVAPLKDGNEGTFTFDFEEKAPFRISRLAIDVEARERH